MVDVVVAAAIAFTVGFALGEWRMRRWFSAEIRKLREAVR